MVGVLEMRCPAVILNGYHKLAECVLHHTGYYITGDVSRRDADRHFYLSAARTTCLSAAARILPRAVEKLLERHSPHGLRRADFWTTRKAHKPVAFCACAARALSQS